MVEMAELLVRVVDPGGNPYDVFTGEPSQCPPIPRIGETVQYRLGSGIVKEVIHIFEGEVPAEDVYRIAILIKSLP
jgi:hypothetical protein